MAWAMHGAGIKRPGKTIMEVSAEGIIMLDSAEDGTDMEDKEEQVNPRHATGHWGRK